MDYTLPIYLSFFLVTLSSFGLFFTYIPKKMYFYSLIGLLGILMNFANRDAFIFGDEGQTISLFILLSFTAQFIYVQKILKVKPPKKMPFLFYTLPFLAFVFMATSRDLLTLFLSLELCSIVMYFLKQKFKIRLISKEMQR